VNTVLEDERYKLLVIGYELLMFSMRGNVVATLNYIHVRCRF